jgi:hypothetical protein
MADRCEKRKAATSAQKTAEVERNDSDCAGCSSGRNTVQFSDGWSYDLVDEIGEAGQRKSAKNVCFGPCSQGPGVGGFVDSDSGVAASKP